MNRKNHCAPRPHPSLWARALFSATLLSLGPAFALAAPFELTYTGSFSSADSFNLASASTPTPFSGPTPFTLNAFFDTTSPNLVAPASFPGFVAYAPSQATITIGTTTYTVAGYNEDPVAGISVSIFDRTNFFTPDRYAIGIIQQPLADGAGIVGDWSSASSDFTVSNLQSTTFAGYNGVGFGAGPGFGPDGSVGTVIPLVLSDGAGQVYSLALSEREEQYAGGAALNTAQLQAVPEPATLALCGTALLAVALRRRTRQ